MKSLLKHPSFYLIVQGLLGAKRARRLCLRDFAKPLSRERVLDVGCGPGFIIDYLPHVDYIGIDIDASYIDYAKKHYGDRATFRCGYLDEATSRELGSFDLILLNGVIHHLNDSEACDMLRILASMLRPTGRLMTLDGCYTDRMSPLSRWMLDHDRGRFVRTESAYRRLLTPEFACVETHLRHNLFYIPYSALVAICRCETGENC